MTEKTPELGRKFDYVLGKATGNLHNAQRSQSMLCQMQRIGLPDNPLTREVLQKHFSEVLNNPRNISQILPNGRVVRESLLMGPRGGVKVESIWAGNRLITVKLLGAIK